MIMLMIAILLLALALPTFEFTVERLTLFRLQECALI